MSAVRKRVLLPLALRVGALGLMLTLSVAQLAGATHVRPRGATPLRVSLVPMVEQCTTPNTNHGPPLAYPACHPPVQASDSVTLGTPDANGADSNSVGYVSLKVKATSPEDVVVSSSISDVRCEASTSVTVCASPNATDGADYSGELQINANIRITDHRNGPALNEAATVVDLPSPVPMTCANTSDTSVGGSCTITTSLTSLVPQSSIHPRAVVAFDKIQISDGGPDGQINTTLNTLFEVQGLSIP
jgi:hypothetical protein